MGARCRCASSSASSSLPAASALRGGGGGVMMLGAFFRSESLDRTQAATTTTDTKRTSFVRLFVHWVFGVDVDDVDGRQFNSVATSVCEYKKALL